MIARKHIAFPAFFLIPPLLFTARPLLCWDGGPTAKDELTSAASAFIERARNWHAASSGFLSTLESALKTHTGAGCPGDFKSLTDVLDALASSAEETQSLAPMYIEVFRGMLEPVRKRGCPGGMVLIEGAYCIDRHEYPGTPETRPRGWTAWNEAAKLCGDAGKRLCTAAEWRRACEGPPCNPGFPETYDPVSCGVRPGYTPPGAAWVTAERADCSNAYGVNDLAGGMWEWTSEEFRGTMRIMRSGAVPDDTAPSCDETLWADPASREGYAGFRCCADPAPVDTEAVPEDAPGVDTASLPRG
ncbi:MAG: SUMF1/EgtB/PvdO family nonheme iron enzyme [bacterium]